MNGTETTKNNVTTAGVQKDMATEVQKTINKEYFEYYKFAEKVFNKLFKKDMYKKDATKDDT